MGGELIRFIKKYIFPTMLGRGSACTVCAEMELVTFQK